MIDKVARLGVMGFLAVAVVITVCGLAAYSVINGVEGDNTTALITVLATSAGGVTAAAGKFFGGTDA